MALETSLDIYSNGEIFASYAKSIQRFLDRGGVLVWGLVPTNFEPFEAENESSLIARLEDQWQTLWQRGVDKEMMLAQSLLSPATCCLVNPDGEKTVEAAFALTQAISTRMRESYKLD